MKSNYIFYSSAELNPLKEEIISTMKKKLILDLGMFTINKEQKILYNDLLFKLSEDYNINKSDKNKNEMNEISSNDSSNSDKDKTILTDFNKKSKFTKLNI